MSASAVSVAAPATNDSSGPTGSGPYVGWAVGLALIVLVIAIGAGLWIHYHGL